MDPNETLRLFKHAILDCDHEATLRYYTDLCEWLNKGGFEPQWRGFKKLFESFNPKTGLIDMEALWHSKNTLSNPPNIFYHFSAPQLEEATHDCKTLFTSTQFYANPQRHI